MKLLKTLVDNKEVLSYIFLFYYEKYMNGSNEVYENYAVGVI